MSLFLVVVVLIASGCASVDQTVFRHLETGFVAVVAGPPQVPTPAFEAAVVEARKAGDDSVLVAVSLSGLALTHAMAQRPSEFNEAASRAVAVLDRSRSSDLGAAMTLFLLGVGYITTNQPAKGAPLLVRGLEYSEHAPGNEERFAAAFATARKAVGIRGALVRGIVVTDDFGTRASFIIVLGQLGAAARPANPVLIRLLKADRDPRVRIEAAAALGKTDPGPDEIAALINALSDVSAREDAANSLKPMVKTLMPGLERDTRTGTPPARRQAAVVLRWIAPAASEEILRILTPGIQDDDLEVRLMSVQGSQRPALTRCRCSAQRSHMPTHASDGRSCTRSAISDFMLRTTSPCSRRWESTIPRRRCARKQRRRSA
ncbi:MAG: HEAT repeat domain-containing protein [Candidatus Rokubacteria bacterium]|nr:HEAT repeat domain-containing protein [Candidatus Rokubacteria bacterium]